MKITKEKIKELQKQQDNPMLHPYTCCSYNGCDRLNQPKEGQLIPTEDGWICPCGKWKQPYKK